jgi:1,4-dihydroxy-2-naphthoate octaprenyltransferase
MFLFDLTTTAINNYTDTKTNDQILQFNRKSALAIIFILLAISTGLGLWLAWLTDIVVLLAGGLCFLCGIFYTYGPVPISRQPLGEIFSGIFYGLFIPFLLLYINMPAKTYLSLGLSWQTVQLDFQVFPLLTVLLLSIAPVCTTANIMLANNICDLEKDIKVKRYTLPYYLGKSALYVFAGLYYLAYAASILLVVSGILHPLYLLTLLTFPLVQKNIRAFFHKQEKASTFILSVKNYILIMAADSFLLLICALIK